MKCVTQYKQKVERLTEEYQKALVIYRSVDGSEKRIFDDYLSKLQALDTELILELRQERGIKVLSAVHL